MSLAAPPNRLSPTEILAAPAKADAADFEGRFREIIADPLNLLIERVPHAGCRDGDLVVLHNGLRVPVSGDHAYYGDFSRILVLNRGVHEPLEEYVFQKIVDGLPAAPVMLELGAYWAHYSMWAKLRRPAATTVMVEPDPVNLAAGRRNFALNGFEGEFVEGFVGRGHFGVDAFASARGLVHLDVLHADIQGYEVEMLADAAHLLARHAIDHVFVSTHSQALHDEVAAVLAGHGYRIEVSSDFDHQTTSYDGLIYASAPHRAASLPNFRPLGRCEIATADAATLLADLVRIPTRPPVTPA